MKKFLFIVLFIFSLFPLSVSAEEYIFTAKTDFPILFSSSIEVVNANHGVYTVESLEDIQHLIAAGIVDYCEPMSYSELFDYTPSDTYYAEQSNLTQVYTQFAWNKGVFGDEVKVAVIDSGLYNAASDFNMSNIVRAKDYTSTQTNSGNYYCLDEIGHGSMVTGIISAAHNTRGVAGIAPNVKIFVFKCFYLNEYGNQAAKNSDIIDAIYEAIDSYDVDIINLSSGTKNSTVFKAAADYAEKKGVLIVSAVGNYGAYSGEQSSVPYYPASYDNVIGVGSTKSDGHKASHSQRNDYVNIMAPGENIYSVRLGGYEQGSGTSFATPHIVGALALAKSLNPSLSRQELIDALYMTCDSMEDRFSGHGRLNIHSLLTYVKATLVPGKLVYSTHNSTTISHATFKHAVFKPEYTDNTLTKLTRAKFVPNDNSLLVWNMDSLSPIIETEEY